MKIAMSIVPVALAQKVSLAFGACYVLIGLLGFVPLVTSTVVDPPVFGDAIPRLLFGAIAVNTFQNLVHIALGTAMILAGVARSRWDLLTKTVAVACLLLVGQTLAAPLAGGMAVNAPGTTLHLITAAVFGYFAMRVPDDDFLPTH